jgi:hypothetical protein
MKRNPNISGWNAKWGSNSQVSFNNGNSNQNGRSLVENASRNNFQDTREDGSRGKIFLSLILNILDKEQSKISHKSFKKKKFKKKKGMKKKKKKKKKKEEESLQ